MELPNLTPGDRTRNEYVALMQKMLYGGKSASRSWQRYVDTFLRDRFDAVPLVADCCVYKIQIDGETLIAGVFVDDIFFFSSSASLNQRFISEFKEHFGDTKSRVGLLLTHYLVLNSNTTTTILPSSCPCRDISPNWRRNSDLKTPNLPLRRCRLTS